ncbi:hypothetical protein KC348_g59 [Hortaea werneckii]|nr:hypothetical protein KC348_g59 [Hortaea werneckii]
MNMIGLQSSDGLVSRQRMAAVEHCLINPFVVFRNVHGACAASGVFSRSAETAEAISQAAFALCRFLVLADSRPGRGG